MSPPNTKLLCEEWCPRGGGGYKPTRNRPWVDPNWEGVPERHPQRERMLAVASGAHPRLGANSLLRSMDENLVFCLCTASLTAPLIVPDDYSTLWEASQAALEGQTIMMRSGMHTLKVGLSNPTLIDKRVRVIGEPGAIFYGGLQLGRKSSGRLEGIEVRGHVWIYGGEWEVVDCKIRNRSDVALVASNRASVLARRCFIGGASKRKASEGVIVHGTARVTLELCDIQRCHHAAISTGGEAGVTLRRCALYDNQSCLCVLSAQEGMRGDFVEVSDSVVRRGGRVWADQNRPERVAGQRNKVHEEEMGETFWEQQTPLGSWRNSEELPGGLSVVTVAGTAAA
uniref:Right handed beta helix domain-containing protein n=1 Tax=Hemiselmis tepida TaxID=464990 RepID=A0A7S0VS68_9CRYP|mmetsp:Transcript_22649/g.57303  ORF Transcript_22649/g.57303 Transcript_22649/m.57303 type:complete len:341 (+) Transcript_22649:174-1196(+)